MDEERIVKRVCTLQKGHRQIPIMEDEKVVLKIKYEGEIRLLTYYRTGRWRTPSLSFNDFKLAICQLYNIIGSRESPRNLKLLVTYNDNNNNTIKITTDQVVRELIYFTSLSGPLVVNVKLETKDPNVVTLEAHMKNLSSTLDDLKQQLLTHEAQFDKLTSPAQIPGLVDDLLRMLNVSSSVLTLAFRKETPQTSTALLAIQELAKERQ